MGLENHSGFFRIPSSFRRSPAIGRRAAFLYRRYRWEKGHDIMANNLIDLIKTRRSVRSYTAEPVPEELLDQVLEAGTFAPTGGGHQSPVIVAVADPGARERLRRLNAAVMGKDTDPYYGAPVIVVVLADGGRGTFVEDGSCVLENLMLAAHALGLSSCWIHREREIFDGAEGKALLREWGLPETLRGVGAIALGYAAGPEGSAAPRKDGYVMRI